MKPILYNSACTEKIAFLSDCTSCTVTEERNGSYLLELEYPVSGEYFAELAEDLVIKAKPNQTDENQFFRIYEITKPLSGLVTVYANHISYDLSGYPIKSYSQTSASASTVISALLGKANTFRSDHTFNLGICDIDTLHSVQYRAVSARAALGGTEGSVLDTFGGEFKFNNFTVSLMKNRGADNGVRIAYGKNLTEMKLCIDSSASYTGVFPFVIDDDNYITLNSESGVLTVPNDSGIKEKILLLDCSSLFGENAEKTPETLRAVAEKYIAENYINAVSASMSVEMIDLSKTSAYDNYAYLEAVNLCDTVKVINPKLGVSLSMKVIKTVYNVLKEKYDRLELGTPRSSFASTIQQAVKTANEAYKQATEGTAALVEEFNQAVNDATDRITQSMGGYVRFNPVPNPTEILIMDNQDINQAQKIWRWNMAGLAYSGTGYNGTYGTSILGEDGKLVITDATANHISANLIRAGSIVSADGNMIIDLDGEKITIKDEETGYKASLASASLQLNYLENKTRLTQYRTIRYTDNEFVGYGCSLNVKTTDNVEPGFNLYLQKGQNIKTAFAITPDGADFNTAVNIGQAFPNSTWRGFRVYREKSTDGTTANVTYAMGYDDGKPTIAIETKDSANKITARLNIVGGGNGASIASMWLNSGSGTSARLGFGKNALLFKTSQIIQVSSGGESATVNSASVESDFMNYFRSSEINIIPETTYTTFSLPGGIVDENGNYTEIEPEVTSRTEPAYAAFSDETEIPSILQKDDMLDLTTMMCLIWKAVQGIDTRIQILEGATTNE